MAIFELHSEDSPKRAGNIAQDGDDIFVFTIPLNTGDYLRLHLGKKTQEVFRAVILESEIDDAIEGALSDGASESQDKATPG